MTADQPVLSDALLNRALREFAAGPEADVLITDVLRTAATTPQEGRLRWPMLALRRSAILVVVALLLAALAASVFVFGQMQPRPTPTPAPPGQSSVVIQRWNGERGEGNATLHTVFAPGSATGTPLTLEIPSNAVSLRWSPDGLHLLYFTRERPVELRGFAETGIFVANADGSDPLPVQVEKPLGEYASNRFFAGAVWAPSGRLFALTWNPGSCTGGVDCEPPTGIEVFDPRGVLVNAFDTGSQGTQKLWSPDSAFIGWHSGSCVGSTCSSDAFHWRAAATPDGPVTTLPLKWGSQGQWSTDTRLLIVATTEEGAVERVYAMAPDGSNEVDVEWPYSFVPVWSPDGRWLAGVDYELDRIVIREVTTGVEVYVDASAAHCLAWSPESDRLVLCVDNTPNSVGFLVVNVDGSRLQVLGDGQDFGWMPAAAQ